MRERERGKCGAGTERFERERAYVLSSCRWEGALLPTYGTRTMRAKNIAASVALLPFTSLQAVPLPPLVPLAPLTFSRQHAWDAKELFSITEYWNVRYLGNADVLSATCGRSLVSNDDAENCIDRQNDTCDIQTHAEHEGVAIVIEAQSKNRKILMKPKSSIKALKASEKIIYNRNGSYAAWIQAIYNYNMKHNKIGECYC